MVDKITPNQIKIMRELLKFKNPIKRQELIKKTGLNATSVHFAIRPLIGFFIEATKSKTSPPELLIKLTEAGRIAIKAFELANK